MLFNSSVQILLFILIPVITLPVINKHHRSKRQTLHFQPKCVRQTTAVDQVVNSTLYGRGKRFVLFPEFINWLNDWRYIARPPEIRFWISNFYPQLIDTDLVRENVHRLVNQINEVIDNDITVREAKDPGEANFHYVFFDYTKCPTDDPQASTTGVQIYKPLYIYPVDLVRESRYRAHGGITLIENKYPISETKFNMQQTFLTMSDFVYDPTVYTCEDSTNECELDLYYVMLHESLHGLGIEHTTNPYKPTPPNEHMQSVMHFSPIRMLCHDDIRAIRMVYQLPVKRDNAEFDDTCRRDFPMNPLQKLMSKLRELAFWGMLGWLIGSCIVFLGAIVYILLRHWQRRRSSGIQKQFSSATTRSWLTVSHQKKAPKIKKKASKAPRGLLWHDDMR